MTEYKIVKLDGGHAFSLEGRAMNVSNEPMDHVTFIDQYEIATADLSGFNVMVVTDFIDQEHLYEHKQVIENFLNEGKIIIANTHIFRPWLPGAGLFMPQEIKSHADYVMEPAAEGTFYEGVDMMELTYRKGVSGFYARGSHPVVNKESEIVLQFTDGTPIVFIDRTATKGTVVAASCRDFLTYATGENSTQLIAPQFLGWLDQELLRLKEGSEA